MEEALFLEILRSLEEYDGIMLMKGGRKPDGCATLYRQGSYDGGDQFRFSDGSGHVAQVLRIQGVTIANTHLKWSRPEEKVGLVQMRELLDRLPGGPAVICGDLNVTPDSEVIRLAGERGLRPAHRAEAFTCNSNGVAKKIDFQLHDESLVAWPDPVPAIDGETPLPSASCPSDHLALRAVFHRR